MTGVRAFPRYPDAEVRTPRAKFTRVLRTICARLQAQPYCEFDAQDIIFAVRKAARVTAHRLWVVGSYARGALACGDLDLVLEVKTEGGFFATSSVCRHLFGSYAGVRVYVGTPLDNESGVKFSEAVQVWGPEVDSLVVLEELPTDASAGRFARAADAFPLRREQMRLSNGRAAGLLSELKAGFLQSSFVPLSELDIGAQPLTHSEFDLDHSLQWRSARKHKLSSLVLAWSRRVQALWPDAPPPHWDHRAECVRTGPHHLYLEQLAPGAVDFDSTGMTSASFLPTPSRRGPNGIWTLTRGPRHPLALLAEQESAWALCDEQGRPGLVSHLDRGQSLYSPAPLALEVFGSESAAWDWLASLSGGEVDPEDPLRPTLLKGTALLSALDQCDFLDGPEQAYPLNDVGVRCIQQHEFEQASAGSVEALRGFLRGLPQQHSRVWEHYDEEDEALERPAEAGAEGTSSAR